MEKSHTHTIDLKPWPKNETMDRDVNVSEQAMQLTLLPTRTLTLSLRLLPLTISKNVLQNDGSFEGQPNTRIYCLPQLS